MTHKFFSINPATEKHLKTYRFHTIADVRRLLKKSQASFERWKTRTVQERADHFSSMSKLLLKEKNNLAKLIVMEMGKPISEAVAEIEKCSWVCDYFAEYAHAFLQDERVKTENKESYVCFNPLGIILAVMPWNFPFWQVFRCAVPALCAGNVVMLKHSNQVPDCSVEIEGLFVQSGFPPAVFTSLLIDAGQVKQIIPDVQAVSLTGSVNAGRNVAQYAGKHLKKIVLELGGADPFVVLDDADLLLASQYAVKSRFLNAGQSCIAAKRFIVTKKQSKEFTKLVIAATKKLVVGDPLDNRTQIGPLVSKQQLLALEQQVRRAIRDGAVVVCGGKKIETKGFFFEPTILTNVTSAMPVMQEEIFGPVLSILEVKNEAEALRVANASRFGLGASIWTKDRAKGTAFAQKIEAGVVAVNSMVKSDPRLPFGGVKDSGVGRELSRYGILEFTNIKSVVVN